MPIRRRWRRQVAVWEIRFSGKDEFDTIDLQKGLDAFTH
jgi:hypothetical protein